MGSSEVSGHRDHASLRKVPRTTSTEHACWHRGPGSLGHGCMLFLFQQCGCGLSTTPSALNDIIHRALTSAHVPARLEPQGMLRSDGKRSDGVSVVPWTSGKCLVWDMTCVDTFAPSYRSLVVQGPGTVAARAESLKEEKYIDLLRTHEFTPITVETSGVFGPRILAFVKEPHRRLRSHTGEEKACTYSDT